MTVTAASATSSGLDDQPEPPELSEPALSADVTRALAVVRPHRLPPSADTRSAFVGGELLTIPYRVYNDPPAPKPPTQRLVLACLYSRHNDGWYRQENLEVLARSRLPWVLPYLFPPMGEYVVEIVLALVPHLSEVDEEVRRFAADNPDLLAVTQQRDASYWDAYYRHRYPSLRDYPAWTVVESLRVAVSTGGTP